MIARRLLTIGSILPALLAAGALAYAIGAGTSLVALVDGVRLEAATRGMLGAIIFPWFLALSAQYFVNPVGDGTCLCCDEVCTAGLNAVVGAPASLAIALMIITVIVKRPRTGLQRVWGAAFIAGAVTGALFLITDHRVAAYAAAACPNHMCGG